LIANAEVVVGNSFHGVVFSVIFEKEFYAVGMGNYSQRVVSLLTALDIPERYIEDGSYSSDRINYHLVRERLGQLGKSSRQYLDISLGNL
jgi:polysaccharide pyruvyl transferase WcaK-like protein